MGRTVLDGLRCPARAFDLPRGVWTEAERADQGTTVRDVRRANRASLLTDLFHGGRQSRQQLGDTTALSQASVSNLVGEMIDEGLIKEAGLVSSDGGRPRALLRVAPGYGYVAGADVGETRVLVELYDLAMSRLGVATYPLAEGDPQGAAARLLEGLAAV